jgi:hypothetical protein
VCDFNLTVHADLLNSEYRVNNTMIFIIVFLKYDGLHADASTVNRDFLDDYVMFVFFIIVKATFRGKKYNHHSLYSILNFDWLIYLQITACK